MPVLRSVVEHGLLPQISFILIIVEEKVAGKTRPQRLGKGNYRTINKLTCEDYWVWSAATGYTACTQHSYGGYNCRLSPMASTHSYKQLIKATP
jgi:hypothetical protein